MLGAVKQQKLRTDGIVRVPVLVQGLLALIIIAILAIAGFVLFGGARFCLHSSCQSSQAHGVPGTDWTRSTLTLSTSALLSTGRPPNRVWAGTDDGIWESSNGGDSWRLSGLEHVQVLSLSASDTDQTIVAGTANGAVYRRAARGDWINIGLHIGPNDSIFSLAVSHTGHTVLAGTIGTLYRGVWKGGAWTWRPVARTGQSAITSIVWAPWNTHLAYASIFGTRPPVISSRDGGRAWRPTTSGLPPTVPAQALLALGTHPPWVILSTMGGGAWRWSNGVWHDISAGLPERHAMPLAALRGHPVVLYAGTMGYGVYIKRGSGRWRRIGHDLNGGAYTVLGIARVSGPPPVLLAGTIRGVFRHTLRSHELH